MKCFSLLALCVLLPVFGCVMPERVISAAAREASIDRLKVDVALPDADRDTSDASQVSSVPGPPPPVFEAGPFRMTYPFALEVGAAYNEATGGGALIRGFPDFELDLFSGWKLHSYSFVRLERTDRGQRGFGEAEGGEWRVFARPRTAISTPWAPDLWFGVDTFLADEVGEIDTVAQVRYVDLSAAGADYGYVEFGGDAHQWRGGFFYGRFREGFDVFLSVAKDGGADHFTIFEARIYPFTWAWEELGWTPPDWLRPASGVWYTGFDLNDFDEFFEGRSHSDQWIWVTGFKVLEWGGGKNEPASEFIPDP